MQTKINAAARLRAAGSKLTQGQLELLAAIFAIANYGLARHPPRIRVPGSMYWDLYIPRYTSIYKIDTEADQKKVARQLVRVLDAALADSDPSNESAGQEEYEAQLNELKNQSLDDVERMFPSYSTLIDDLRQQAGVSAAVITAAAGESVYGSIVVVRTKQTLSWDDTPESEVRRVLLRNKDLLGGLRYGRDWKWASPDPDDQIIVTTKHNKTFVGKSAMQDLLAYLGIA